MHANVNVYNPHLAPASAYKSLALHIGSCEGACGVFKEFSFAEASFISSYLGAVQDFDLALPSLLG